MQNKQWWLISNGKFILITIHSAKIRSQIVSCNFQKASFPYRFTHVLNIMLLVLFHQLLVWICLIFQQGYPNLFWPPGNQEQQDCISSGYYLGASSYPECCKSIFNMGQTWSWKKTANRRLKFDKILAYGFTLVPKLCAVAFRNECTWGRQKINFFLVVSLFIAQAMKEQPWLKYGFGWWTRSRSK